MSILTAAGEALAIAGGPFPFVDPAAPADPLYNVIGWDATNSRPIVEDIKAATGNSNHFSQDFGDGVQSTLTVTHSLGTDIYHAEVVEVATKQNVLVQIVKNINTVVIGPFQTAPTINQYRVIVG